MPGSLAMPGKYSTARYASIGTMLEPSLVAPLRVTIKLSGSPVATRVWRMPVTSESITVTASTTRAITATVRSARVRR